MNSPAPPRLSPVLQALLVTFLWSTSWILTKLGLVDIPPLTFAALRYTLAFLLLAALLLSRPRQRADLRALSAKSWLQLSLLGLVFYSVTQGAMFLALERLPAVTLSLALSFTPAAVALLAMPLLGERLSWQQWLGIAVFLLGVAVYLAPTDQHLSLAAAGIALLALAANAAGSTPDPGPSSSGWQSSTPPSLSLSGTTPCAGCQRSNRA